jgi:hypothetical protein
MWESAHIEERNLMLIGIVSIALTVVGVLQWTFGYERG